MRIYFSGWAHEDRPHGIEQRPSFMLTYYDLYKKQKNIQKLLTNYLKRRKQKKTN